MTNKTKKTDVIKNREDLFFVSYTIPFLIANSISTMIIGNFYSLKYSIIYEGFQARVIGFLFLVLGLILFYKLYVEIPKKITQKKLVQFKNILYKSAFLYLTITTAIFTVVLDYYRISFKAFIFLILLVLNAVAQFYFNRKYRNIID